MVTTGGGSGCGSADDELTGGVDETVGADETVDVEETCGVESPVDAVLELSVLLVGSEETSLL